MARRCDLAVIVLGLTCDNGQVIRYVCSAWPGRTGTRLEPQTDEALMARVDDTTLFCRVIPPQESRTIGTLRGTGHIVGYIADDIKAAQGSFGAR
jgi:Mg2+-importing ATPase